MAARHNTLQQVRLYFPWNRSIVIAGGGGGGGWEDLRGETEGDHFSLREIIEI